MANSGVVLKPRGANCFSLQKRSRNDISCCYYAIVFLLLRGRLFTVIDGPGMMH